MYIKTASLFPRKSEENREFTPLNAEINYQTFALDPSELVSDLQVGVSDGLHAGVALNGSLGTGEGTQTGQYSTRDDVCHGVSLV